MLKEFCTRTVDNHMLRLRQKLESDPSHPSHFLTVHGLGYKFVPEARKEWEGSAVPVNQPGMTHDGKIGVWG